MNLLRKTLKDGTENDAAARFIAAETARRKKRPKAATITPANIPADSNAKTVFYQQNGDVTKAYYAEMNKRGPLGEIAVALFRTQKRSSRAKDYKRGKYRRSAYDVKSWSMSELCRLLTQHADKLNIEWGWAKDANVLFGERTSWVLYVELPNGQMSFHSPDRMEGPEFISKWDGVRGASEGRVITFCAAVERNHPILESAAQS